MPKAPRLCCECGRYWEDSDGLSYCSLPEFIDVVRGGVYMPDFGGPWNARWMREREVACGFGARHWVKRSKKDES